MKRNRMTMAVIGVIAAGSLIGVGFASADTSAEPTTREQAQAALDHIDQDQATIQAYLDSLSTPTPPPSPSATPSVNEGVPTNVAATAGPERITLSWEAPTTPFAPTGYAYGRSGQDSTGAGPWTSNPVPLTTTGAVLDKLVPGTAYDVFVETIYSDGARKRVTLTRTPTSGPTPTASATPTATPTNPPAGGNLSGLAWSSGVWGQQSASITDSFVSQTRGGTPVDNILVYTARNSMASQNNPSAWRSALPASFNGATQNLVLGLTTWTGDNAFMTNAQARQIGTSLCSVDNVDPTVRLDWEMNLPGGAGNNGADLTASNYNAWVARFHDVATGIKATCPSVLIDFNPNHGNDQTAGCNTSPATSQCSRRAFQAVRADVDFFGIDIYDRDTPVRADGSGWPSFLNGFNNLDESRTYAVANGKKWSVPEWGLWKVNPGGGDDREYISRMIRYFIAHAGDVGYETYFNETADYIDSNLFPNAPNPQSAAQYRSDILANRS